MANEVLALQTFEECEAQFQKLPMTCQANGQCDESVFVEITADELVDLAPSLDGVKGYASYEKYPDGNSILVELVQADEGFRSMCLVSDGHFYDSIMPGPGSDDYIAYQKWLNEEDALPENNQSEGTETELTPELSEVLKKLISRLVDKVIV